MEEKGGAVVGREFGFCEKRGETVEKAKASVEEKTDSSKTVAVNLFILLCPAVKFSVFKVERRLLG